MGFGWVGHRGEYRLGADTGNFKRGTYKKDYQLAVCRTCDVMDDTIAEDFHINQGW